MNTIISINGNWDKGIILDKYIISSDFIEYDAFGNPQFNTIYTPVGKLLHDMKYNGHYNTSQQIVRMYLNDLKKWVSDKNIDVIVPTPPTENRILQPVFAIGEALSQELGIFYNDKVLIKTNNKTAKDMPKDDKNLKNAIKQVLPAKRRCNILLLDDLYQTGATANECVSVLKRDSLVDKVYYLAIAKTKK